MISHCPCSPHPRAEGLHFCFKLNCFNLIHKIIRLELLVCFSVSATVEDDRWWPLHCWK